MYKLVRELDGKYYSLFAAGCLRVEYIPGVKTKAKSIYFDKLYCMNNIDDILNYLNGLINIDSKGVKLFSCNKENYHPHNDGNRGTILCESITLKEEIKFDIVYKLVYSVENKYESWSAIGDNSLDYEINKTTTPKIERSKLFCFSSIEEAIKYNEGMPYSTVLKCIGLNPTKLEKEYSDYSWNKKVEYKSTDNTLWNPPPKNTILCDAIFPLSVQWHV